VEVCPTSAISINLETGAPVVDSANCIFCGVCVARCPAGAIYVDGAHGAVVVDQPNKHFVTTAEYTEVSMYTSRKALEKAGRTGALLCETDAIVGEVGRRITEIRPNLSDAFPNLLTRNLLRTLGVAADMRRTGNNHLRADLVLGVDGRIERGVVEVEFGDQAILDAPRDVLDDIAVFVSRHGWSKKNMIAFIVGDVLPNRRSEYWRIIKDIREILAIPIATVTIFALMLLVWGRKKLPKTINTLAFADSDTTSYRKDVLEKLVGRRLNLSSKSSALVEIVK